MTYWRAGEPVLWYTQGSQSGPTNTTVLADTGQVAALGNYQALIVISTDTAGAINIQWRAADNTSNVDEHRVFPGANQNMEFLLPVRVNNVNERYRVIPNATINGNVCASIFWQKMA
jgi:hypothetical protein